MRSYQDDLDSKFYSFFQVFVGASDVAIDLLEKTLVLDPEER